MTDEESFLLKSLTCIEIHIVYGEVLAGRYMEMSIL